MYVWQAEKPAVRRLQQLHFPMHHKSLLPGEHTTSRHFASLALCFLPSVVRAADPADTPASIRVCVLSREVIEIMVIIMITVFYMVVQIVLVLEGGCILLSGLLSCQVLTMWCASVAAAAMQARGGSAASGGSTGGSVAAAGGGVQIL